MTKLPRRRAAPPEPREALPWLDLLGRAGAISALVAAWLLMAGWSFAYVYFEGFGIGISGLSPDWKALPVWGAVAAFELIWWVLGGALALLVLLAASGSRLLPGLARAVILAAAVAAAYAGAVMVGRAKAQGDLAFFRAADWPGFVPVRILLDHEADGSRPALDALSEDLMDGCHRLIYADAARLYVFRPVAGRPGLALSTTVVSRGDVAALRLGPLGLPPCG